MAQLTLTAGGDNVRAPFQAVDGTMVGGRASPHHPRTTEGPADQSVEGEDFEVGPLSF